MDAGFIISSIIDFVKYLLILSFVSFILFKIFSPLREKLEDRYELSWIKSAILMNLAVIFVSIFAFYLYFIFVGAAQAPLRDPDIEFTFTENALIILVAVVRIAVVSIILALGLLFFEFLSSMVIDMQKKKKYSIVLKQFIGVLVSAAVFLLLFIYVFNWVPVGLFVYIFYGGYMPAVPL